MSEETNSTTVTTPSDTEVRIEREFDAPRELVWKAYTDPELLAEWLGPRRLTGTFASREARDAILEAGMERGVSEGYEKLDGLLARRRG